MTVQYLASTFTTSSLNDFVLAADQQQPIRFSASDLGYDFSEEVLANFMTAPIPANLMDQPVAPVSPDEFETAYTWFIS